MIDLSVTQIELITGIIRHYLPACEIMAYGSRTQGAAKQFSDLDIVLITDNPIPVLTLFYIKSDLSESDLPFRVDVLDWLSASPEFRQIITPQLIKL